MIQKPALGEGEEWVWDYPRPPRLERSSRMIRVEFAGVEIASTAHAWRVLETSHPPVYYIPQSDVRMEYLRAADGSSYCEWKGSASYYDVAVNGRIARRAAWTYPSPSAPFRELAHAIAFYPGRVDACFVDDERVKAQEGDFYGGWITHEIVGPFKGPPGTNFW